MKKIKMQDQGQKELPGMPEPSALAMAATEYLNKRDYLQRAQHEIDLAKKRLAIEFTAAGKSSIKVSGYTLNYMHKETDSIIVKEEA